MTRSTFTRKPDGYLVLLDICSDCCCCIDYAVCQNNKLLLLEIIFFDQADTFFPLS